MYRCKRTFTRDTIGTPLKASNGNIKLTIHNGVDADFNGKAILSENVFPQRFKRNVKWACSGRGLMQRENVRGNEKISKLLNMLKKKHTDDQGRVWESAGGR